MLQVSSWLDFIRLKHALYGYTPYCPPHPGLGCELTSGQANENFEYFLEQREMRLGYLSRFLSQFWVELEFTEKGMDDIGWWFYRYAGLLFNPRKSAAEFESYRPTWKGKLVGLNVPHDLAIYAGEYVIRLNPSAKWILFSGLGTTHGKDSMGHYHPFLGGLSLPYDRKTHNIARYLYNGCNKRARRIRFGPILYGDLWIRPKCFVNSIKYLSGIDQNSLEYSEFL